MKRKKDKERKVKSVQVMCNAEQKELMERAASQGGISLSSWALSHLLPIAAEAAKKV